MANKNLFKSIRGLLSPKADTQNNAGGRAYQLDAKHALAQFAVTGTLGGTFYANAEQELKNVIDLALKTDPEFIAKVAVYARKHGRMKDMPALLTAMLATLNGELLAKVFPKVIDNGRMLRTFVQIMRSGITGRKSLGSGPKKLVQNWLNGRTDKQLLRDTVGSSPSIVDVVKMVHPRPDSKSREAFYGWLLGKDYDAEQLPQNVKTFLAWKTGVSNVVPEVPFQMLTHRELTTAQWTRIAEDAGWHMLRMNLNTFNRHGVFKNRKVVKDVAKRLKDRKEVRKAKVFPYQLLAAWMSTEDVPTEIQNALHDAMEIATENVPRINGKVYVAIDISGSMDWSVTGYRKGATSKVTCRDVAALVAACILRKNLDAVIIPFHTQVEKCRLTARDSVMTNAKKLRELPSGGTDCSVALRELNRNKRTGDLVLYVSDNESWFGGNPYGWGTSMQAEWEKFKARNPHAKLACLDIAPNESTQAKEAEDVLNIGGFSDRVFEVIKHFADGNASTWVHEIEKIEI